MAMNLADMSLARTLKPTRISECGRMAPQVDLETADIDVPHAAVLQRMRHLQCRRLIVGKVRLPTGIDRPGRGHHTPQCRVPASTLHLADCGKQPDRQGIVPFSVAPGLLARSVRPHHRLRHHWRNRREATHKPQDPPEHPRDQAATERRAAQSRSTICSPGVWFITRVSSCRSIVGSRRM